MLTAMEIHFGQVRASASLLRVSEFGHLTKELKHKFKCPAISLWLHQWLRLSLNLWEKCLSFPELK